VPFIRYTRDKRGYETTLVLHAYRSAQVPQRTRVLYLFRSPSNLKVGRKAFEPEVVEALEHTHPDLSFDWNALRREPEIGRAEYRGRGTRQRPRPGAHPVESREVAPPVVEDQTVLGRALGAAEARRLRNVYSELIMRVARRARSPEDRDRLTERLARLNPDDWPDEAAVRAAVPSVEAEWKAIAVELPSRRRGSRGGRRRADVTAHSGTPGDDAGGDSEPSAIMSQSEDGESDANPADSLLGGADRGAAGPGDRGAQRPVGPADPDEPDPGPAADVPGDG
jgi:hypothetical protein